MFTADYSKFRDIDLSNILGIDATWGMDDGKSLVNELERLFDSIQPGAHTMCMRDMSGLHIVCADLTIHKTIVCNKDTFPTLRVVDAIRASMSLPLMFRPYVHEGHYWVDGAVRANFPWDQLPNDEARSAALGFAFSKPWIYRGPTSFSEYMFSMIHFDEPEKIQRQQRMWPNILWFPCPPFPAWFIKLKPEDYALLESIGNRAADEWLTSTWCLKTPEAPRPSAGRRNSPPSLQECTTELSGSHPPSHAPSQGCPLPLSRNIPPSFRRWSV